MYTVGHSTLALADFIALLRIHGIAAVADVRSYPRSRTNPQFNREVLPESLADEGIAYLHVARLGGRRGPRKDLPPGGSPNAGWESEAFRNYADYALTPAFQEGLEELLAHADAPTAIMCSEAVWWRCHRRIIADYLVVRGLPVWHVPPPAPPKPHLLTPFARPQPDGTILYPAAEEPSE